MASLPTILLLLAALSAGATVIAAIIAFRSQREASSAIFPIVREEERNRAQRARISIFVWIAVTALFIGGWLGTLRLSGSAEASPTAAAVIEAQPTPEPASTAAPVIEPTATAAPLQNQELTGAPPTDTPLPAATDTPLPVATDTPVPPATATATPPPTATATNTTTPLPPSATPSATATSTPTRVPLPGERVPAPAGVRVGPIQFSAELDREQSPVNPAATFTDGLAQVYAVFSFRGLDEGLPFKIIWYKNGAEIARDEGQWEWGQQGQSFVFLSPKGPGLYKLELWVNDTVVATKLFEITPRPK